MNRKRLFTYVEKLLEGKLAENYDIATFASKHNQIESKLTELKNIIIKYYPKKRTTTSSMLFFSISSTVSMTLLHTAK